MSAVIEAISDVVEGAVEFVGDVVETVVDVAETVVETIAENPILIVAAIAAPYALAAFAAEAGFAATILEVAGAAEAVEAGVAVLEATEAVTAVASAETFAASAVVEELGVSAVLEATEAASLVSEGASVAEAVTAASEGAASVSSFAEAASTTVEGMSNMFSTLSEGASNIMSTIGETLLPEADPMLQKMAGQLAVNTATNGGDFNAALQSTLISAGTGFLGSEIAAETGSKLAGQVASQAIGQVARTGDLNVEGLAAGTLGSFVGNEVGDETGSKLLGSAASTVTRDLVQGKDGDKIFNDLLNVGASNVGNMLTGQITDFVKSAGGDEAVSGTETPDAKLSPDVSDLIATVDTSKPVDATTTTGTNTVDTTDTTDTIDTVSPTRVTTETTDTTPTGGLATVSQDITTPTAPIETLVTTPVVSGLAPVDTSANIDVNSAADTSGLAQVKALVEEDKPVDISGESTPAVSPTGTKPASLIEEKPNDFLSNFGKGATGALTATGTNLIRQNLTKGLTKNVVRPTTAAKTPTAAPKPTSGLTAVKPKTMTAQQMAAMQKSQFAKPPAYVPPKKMDVTKLTPLTNISGLTALLGKG